jgi:hypothetical protein
MGPAPDFFRRRQADLDGIEIGDRVLHFERARTKQGIPPLPALMAAASFEWPAASFLCFAVAESLGPAKRSSRKLLAPTAGTAALR